MKRCYPINRILRQIASTVPLQFVEVDFQMQLDAQARTKIIRDEKLRIVQGEFEFERFFVSKMREMAYVFIDWILEHTHTHTKKKKKKKKKEN